MKSVWLVLVLGLVACSKPNPEVCCISEADCTAIGVSDGLRPCDTGLACVDNACVVPSCLTAGCDTSAPVCDVVTDVCTGCVDNNDCARFPQAANCDVSTGTCVECLTSDQCDASSPVCDAGSCRGCRADAECASGVCKDDGTCADEANAVYLSSTGQDAGTCTRSAPCKTFNFALPVTSTDRSDIVMLNGTYSENQVFIDSGITPAPSITIHGSGSMVISTAGDVALFNVGLPTRIKDLRITVSPFGAAVLANAAVTLERLNIQAPTGLSVKTGTATVHDTTIKSTSGSGIVVSSGGSLTFDRGTISGGTSGIVASTGGAAVSISNLLVFGTSKAGIDLGTSFSVGGSIGFTTVADTGASSTDFAGIICPSGFPVRSSVVWTPGSGRPAASSCGFETSSAGPVGVVGAANTDPLFVNEAAADYHLSANSPARDAVDAGPALDFEGDPRPRGQRFDIGADEAP